MPSVARDTLLRRLHESHEMETLLTDVEALTGLRPQFFCITKVTGRGFRAPLATVKVGRVELGILDIAKPMEARAHQALKRWLQSAVNEIADHLLHQHQNDCSNALPGAIDKAATILRTNAHEDLSLQSVAAVVKLSRERLSRLFHESLGVTFSDYLNAVRLERSRTMLRQTEDKIADVAFASGFQSVSQFNRRFKHAEGISPREYRRRAFYENDPDSKN